MSSPFLDEDKETTMSPVLLGASAFLALAYVVRALLARPQRLDLPVVGKPDDANFEAALLEGTAKYPNTPYIIPSIPKLVVLPISTHDELRNLPENKASFVQDISHIFFGKQTGLGENTPPLIKAIKTDLNRHVASTVEALQDETRYALDEFGSCENWTKVTVAERMARLVALLSGRVFVGKPLSRNEEWIKTTLEYTVDAVKARDEVLRYPELIQNLAAPFLPQIRTVKQNKAKAAQLLRPIIEECMRKFKEGKMGDKESTDEFDDNQGTFISWLLKWTDEKNREDPFMLADSQMTLSFAAIHTTSMAISHVLFDLASHPEFIEPLREEIEQVIAEDGTEVDGSGLRNLKQQSFTKLKKLDSFLKESQRLNPPTLVANFRLTTSTLHLSTGHVIPKGTRICYDALTFNMSNPDLSTIPHDPSDVTSLDPPTTFSPFRWSSLRATPGNESKFQFVTTSKQSMNFGHGNHACPGRFFAGFEIKIVIVELLMNWDFRLVGDEEGKGGSGKRPKNFLYDVSVVPDPTGQLEFRRRKF
ncbi:574f7162-9d91-4dd4-b04b-ccc169e0b55a [Sclerotinia trifoliorum]|uniref:574f7162-9d91-4dd4-b04b-ccc169e0b55a n=1 Tax=Sclerotinia trifoliorum TaxID=28548 RepID=A0A8H2VVH1_9HELO|nr:574f7162-9d91-4dd4-b04b-ccc169e0b55a [Sclerotinia trifoliorum]